MGVIRLFSCLDFKQSDLPAELAVQVRREMASSMGAAGTGGSPGAAIPTLPSFNGNVITPGTSFMDRLSQHLRAFLAGKLASADEAWRKLLVGRRAGPGQNPGGGGLGGCGGGSLALAN